MTSVQIDNKMNIRKDKRMRKQKIKGVIETILAVLVFIALGVNWEELIF